MSTRSTNEALQVGEEKEAAARTRRLLPRPPPHLHLSLFVIHTVSVSDLVQGSGSGVRQHTLSTGRGGNVSDWRVLVILVEKHNPST